MCDEAFTNVVTLVGSLILLPFVTVGFGIGWLTIAAIGIIIYIGFPLSAIFLDSIRWIANRFKDPATIKEEDAPTARLKKAAKIFILIFKIMADIKDENTLTEGLNRV